ncbi:MAG: 37S ribosomal protein S23 mitochondrial [Heterodermia speciosa]|uniref:Small ribosomal subunit protein mS29 n=1 Tax=Heterodermia speciosa TaxID=116794 RepID=A0A8H3FJW5_9LECA|nr:MAG: 37S ribosomal protein S23 mitochondrial [Heterodermia speciosa]
MSFRPCWRCFLRASDLSTSIWQPSPARLSASAAPFSTSTSSLTNASADRSTAFRAKVFNLKKEKPKNDVRAKRPAPGERKAYRKRIILSNTNALPIYGMEDFTVENMCKQESKGMVLGIPGNNVDQLRAVEAFKPTQAWGMFRRPGMLVRNETVEYAKLLEELQSQGKSLRRVLVGERGSGKSVMVLQAMTMAFLKGWTVINIPEAQELIIGHYDYAPLSGSSPLLFIQKSYTARLLSQISRSNPQLETLRLSSTPPSNFPIPIPANISLARLAGLGASDPEIAWPVFQLLISELTLPNSSIAADDQKRPPLLFTLDSLANAMKDQTAYMTASFKPIHAHDLTLLKTFMDYLSGASPLPNGGLILAATSASNPPPNPSLDLALAKLETHSASQSSAPSPDPYNPSPATPNPFYTYDQRVMDIFEGPNGGQVEVQRLPGLSKEEAKGLMEYWAKSGILRQDVDERLVGEKWSLSGGGIVGELERGCIRMRI